MEWISVKDRLPKHGECVLVVGKRTNEITLACFEPDNASKGVWDLGAHIDFSGGKITHWMPLPEPPEV